MTIHILRAGANGTTPQTGVLYQQYVPLQIRNDFSYAGVHGMDTGGEFNNSTFEWTPQAGPISWNAQACPWEDFGGVANTWLTLTMFKIIAGSPPIVLDFHAGLGGQFLNQYAGTGVVINNGKDVANGTDKYVLKIFETTTDGLPNGQVNSDPRHVWLNAFSFGA